MINRDNVIDDLIMLKRFIPATMWKPVNDAMSLLKEKEAVEPKVSSTEQRCGNCNKIIEMDGWITCPWCGKRIDWEGWWKKNGTRNQNS